MNEHQIENEDVGEAIREGRGLRPARAYRIQVAKGDLNFQPVSIADPVPLGRQILMAAGVRQVEEWSVFAITSNGEFEDVRLDETFDLRGQGAERFVAFNSDRDFRLTVAGRQVSWGKPLISGEVIHRLAEADKDDAIFLDVPGGTERLIEPCDLVDLSEPGIERFLIRPRPAVVFTIFVNSRPEVIKDKRVSFEQLVKIAYPDPQDPNARFTITYRHVASQPHAGELSAGESVEVNVTGSRFNVRRTVQS